MSCAPIDSHSGDLGSIPSRVIKQSVSVDVVPQTKTATWPPPPIAVFAVCGGVRAIKGWRLDVEGCDQQEGLQLKIAAVVQW